jgi:hypothetical protein
VGKDNLYAGPQKYWRIVSQRASDAEPTEELPLDPKASKKFGFGEPYRLTTVVWQELPPPTRPVHLHTKADYLLSDDSANVALRTAGLPAGFDPSLLPEYSMETKAAAAAADSSPMVGPAASGDKPASSLPDTMMLPIVPMIKPKPAQE